MSSVLVTGSRDWPLNSILNLTLTTLDSKYGFSGSTLVNGGARGVDTVVADLWRLQGWGNVVTVLPDWNLHGKSAGIKRNIDMLNMEPNLVIGFVFNTSKGATFTINEAKKRGIETVVFSLDVDRRKP